MNNEITLETLTDRQKIWLSQISYLDISKEGRDKILNGGLSVAELKNYLDNPNEPFNGNFGFVEPVYDFSVNMMTGTDDFPTKLDVLESLIENGLGDLKITNVSDVQQEITSSGFQALTFVDSKGNVGISYRGSDFDFSAGGARDWLESDFLEYFTNDSTQRNEALEYFNANKSHNGNNYIYGHSLGGNLTSHVYLENYNEIQQAFTINGNPINQKLLDTPEKVEAFKNSEKYNCNVVCGDIVGNLKSCELYEDNVNYIKNNDIMKTSAISAHMIQSATFDEDGNFVYASKEEMKEKMGDVKATFTSFVQNVRETMNDIENKLNEAKSNIKHIFSEYKEKLNNSFKKKFDEFNYDSIQDEKNEFREVSINEFQNAAKTAESEYIETIRMQINQYKSKMLSEMNQNNMYQNSFEQTEENYSHTR